jgi:rare lipoprotein A
MYVAIIPWPDDGSRLGTIWRIDVDGMVIIAGLVTATLIASGCASADISPTEPAPGDAVPIIGPAPPQGATVAQPAPTAPQTTPPAAAANSRGRGGYYLDDGPGDNPPADLDSIPDAQPRMEPLHRAAMRPYSALGNDYVPMTSLAPYKARGVASWYGRRYHGRATSTGETYDMYGMTAAHPVLPLPSYVRVTSLRNGRSVVVRVNDRGPFRNDRLIDLSYTAAYRLGLLADGSGMVEVEAILPEARQIAAVTPAGQAPPSAAPIPVAAPAGTNGVFLQLGAFAERSNADDFVNKMRSELPGFTSPIGVLSVAGIHRVQSGPFPDRDAARQEAERIAIRLGAKPFVVVR